MAGVHNLVKKEVHSFAFPQYRHYRECSCGFQCRLDNEIAADDQFKRHQEYHGFKPLTPEEMAEPKNTQELKATLENPNVSREVKEKLVKEHKLDEESTLQPGV